MGAAKNGLWESLYSQIKCLNKFIHVNKIRKNDKKRENNLLSLPV